MTDKILISLDDVHSPAVNQKLAHQNNVDRANEAFRRQLASAPSPAAGPLSLIYNTLVYMTLFGFAGGMVAWPLGEIVDKRLDGQSKESAIFLATLDEINTNAAAGEISDAEAEAMYAALFEQFENNPYARVLSDESLSDEERTARLKRLDDRMHLVGWVSTIIYCAVCGAAIAGFLSISGAVVGRNLREAIVNGSVGICLGILGGVIVGLFINQLYNALGGGAADAGDADGGIALRAIVGQVVARSIGWGIVGLFLALAPGVVMKSFKRFAIGLVGGFLGGLIGGGLFDVVGIVTGADWLSRYIGLVAIGSLAGLGTGLIENVAKTGWMKVTGGLIAGKQFILYKNPTLIGSSPQCDIYLFKDVGVAPQHAAIRKLPGGYEIQDLGSGGTIVNGSRVGRARLSNDDRIQIGGTTFSFQEKAKSRN